MTAPPELEELVKAPFNLPQHVVVCSPDPKLEIKGETVEKVLGARV